VASNQARTSFQGDDEYGNLGDSFEYQRLSDQLLEEREAHTRGAAVGGKDALHREKQLYTGREKVFVRVSACGHIHRGTLCTSRVGEQWPGSSVISTSACSPLVPSTCASTDVGASVRERVSELS